MADNVIVNQPSSVGATIATEDVSGVQHQKVKVEFGGDGVATLVDTGTPLPVTDAAAESSLASIDGKITAINTGAVVVASSALPSGAASAANQATEIASLASIDAGIPAALGQTTMAASMPVAIASNQSAIPISGTVTVDTSLLATSAKQDTGNTSLASIDTKTPALGQALAAASTPVVLTAAQITTLTPQTNALTDTQLRASAVPVSNTNLDVALSTRLKAADTLAAVTTVGTVSAVTAITNALPAGSNIIGKTGIDQTTPGTTNKVSLGSDVVHTIIDSGSTVVTQGTATNLKTQAENYQGGTAVGSANPLQVTLANTGANATAVKTDGSAVIQPVSGTVTVTPSGTQNENLTQVNSQTVNVGIGSSGTGTQRVAVASDSSIATVAAVTAITNALPAGTNAIGKLAANSGVDIGDVDVTSLPSLIAGTAIIGKVGIDQTTPGTTNKVSIGTDGTVAINTALPAGTNAIGKLAANDGVDIGDVTVNNAAGASAVNIQDGGNSITVDNGGTFAVQATSVIPGTAATNLGKAEDSVHTTGDTGVMALGVGNEAQATLAADGDYIPLATDVKGNNMVVGNIAHDGIDAGNPIKTGGKVSTSITTPVSDADRVNSWYDEFGRQVMSDKDTELGLTIGITGLRDRLFVQRCTVLSDSLADGIALFWLRSVVNGGTIIQTDGEGQLKTSTDTAGASQLSSPNVAYYPGMVAWMNSAIRFGDTGVVGNIRRIGMFTVSGTTPQEGFYYELNGTSLTAVTVKAGVATAVAQASWTKNAVFPFTLDANYHSFEIRYTANSVWFYIDNVLRHNVSGTSASLTSSLSLPITVTNIKTSGATDVTFAIRNIGNGRFGQNGGVVNETGLSAVEALAVGGGTPNDSVDTGNPLKIGGYASSSQINTVSNGDRVNAWFTNNGVLNVIDVNGDYARRIQEEILERTKIQMLNISQAAGGGNYQFEYR